MEAVDDIHSVGEDIMDRKALGFAAFVMTLLTASAAAACPTCTSALDGFDCLLIFSFGASIISIPASILTFLGFLLLRKSFPRPGRWVIALLGIVPYSTAVTLLFMETTWPFFERAFPGNEFGAFAGVLGTMLAAEAAYVALAYLLRGKPRGEDDVPSED